MITRQERIDNNLSQREQMRYSAAVIGNIVIQTRRDSVELFDRITDTVVERIVWADSTAFRNCVLSGFSRRVAMKIVATDAAYKIADPKF